MPQIKLPASDQFEHVILSDDKFTVETDGFHAFGATVGRGHQQILDISSYQSLTITASSSLGLVDKGKLVVLLFDENGRLTSGADPLLDPAVVDRYERPLTAPGTITIGESRANRIDTSGAVGAAVVFLQGQAGADLQVRVLGSRNNKQLEALHKAQTSALLASGEISVSLAGNHYFGKTTGRGYQELLDVSAYKSLIVTVDAEGVSSDQKATVLLYDKADRVPTGVSAPNDPAFVERVGLFSVANGTRSVYRVNVADVQGAIVEFLAPPVGATISVRVTGSQGADSHSIERIAEVSLSHADLFNAGGDALMKMFNWRTEGKYRRILFYATSSFPVPIEVRGLEAEGGAVQMIRWDGETFGKGLLDRYDTVVVPSVSNPGGVRELSRFPVHHALRLFQDGIYSLHIRVTAREASAATDVNGNPYEFQLLMLGVK